MSIYRDFSTIMNDDNHNNNENNDEGDELLHT